VCCFHLSSLLLSCLFQPCLVLSGILTSCFVMFWLILPCYLYSCVLLSCLVLASLYSNLYPLITSCVYKHRRFFWNTWRFITSVPNT
jgi:hypothetical protein